MLPPSLGSIVAILALLVASGGAAAAGAKLPSGLDRRPVCVDASGSTVPPTVAISARCGPFQVKATYDDRGGPRLEICMPEIHPDKCVYVFILADGPMRKAEDAQRRIEGLLP